MILLYIASALVIFTVYFLTRRLFKQEELSEKSILAAKKDELNAASKQWKTRVEKTDADKFSVAGRMEKSEKPMITINIPTPDKEKRTPKAKRFKGKEGESECGYQ